jgi:hypothetical protein
MKKQMALATNFQKQNNGKLSNKATSRAGQTYTANSAATECPQFDYPKTLKAMLLFMQLFQCGLWE